MTPMLFMKDGKSEAQKKKRAEELLELVGLAERKDNTLSQLSGGEQQRVAIAIALANEPKLLLADEPTGAVDRKTADDILDMFRKLNEQLGITIVIVTHDNELASKVNRVISIRDGKMSTKIDWKIFPLSGSGKRPRRNLLCWIVPEEYRFRRNCSKKWE